MAPIRANASAALSLTSIAGLAAVTPAAGYISPGAAIAGAIKEVQQISPWC